MRCSVSGIQSAALVYLGEFHGERTRARAVTIATMFMGLSLIYMSVMAMVVLPWSFVMNVGGFIEFRSWRLYVQLTALVLLFAFVAAGFLPESPQYLLALGRQDEALAAVRFAYSMNTRNATKVKYIAL